MSIRFKLRIGVALLFLPGLILCFGAQYFFSASDRLPFGSESSFFLYGIFVVLIMLCLCAAVLLLLEKMVISRIYSLSSRLQPDAADVKNINQDEVTFLTKQINDIHTQLAEDEQLSVILENIMDLVIELDSKGNMCYVSPSHKTLLGYEPDEVLQMKDLEEFFHPDDISAVFTSFMNVIKNRQPERIELRCRHKEGHYLWFESLHYPLIRSEGDTGMLVSSRDITDRKQMEEKLLYLSHNDALTDLYNRTYFEQEMRRLKNTRNIPVGIIICDVDGLKLINDGIGHDAGDRLLRKFAFVLKSCFRDEDMVARIGGDEFAVLLPSSNSETVQQAVERIQSAISEYNQTNPKLPFSISIGYAVGEKGENLNDVFKQADDNMYRDKMLRTVRSRTSTAQILIKALESRDHGMEGHAERLQMLMAKFASALGMEEQKIRDLCLFARYHDIGKIGIPDRIFFKAGSFNEEEKKTMQRHCEIGHRIARSAPEVAHIADWILKHHEQWDGSGYPFGMEGKEIPYECRMFSIVDAFDAMTSPRIYRKTKTFEEAVEELKMKAGIQFDPELIPIFLDLLAELPEEERVIEKP